ncbi:hypothetical protein B0H12DRAFT_1111287 [Mycena haematopus]|nr:hypothetical protein B0H12DRAFT_1111287 [Mycena haematopus]
MFTLTPAQINSNAETPQDTSRHGFALNVKQIARPLTVTTGAFRPLLICLGVQVDAEPPLLLNLLSLLFFDINDEVGRQNSSSFKSL